MNASTQTNQLADAAAICEVIASETSTVIDILSRLIGEGNEDAEILCATRSLMERIGMLADAVISAQCGGNGVASRQKPTALHWLLDGRHVQAMKRLEQGAKR